MKCKYAHCKHPSREINKEDAIKCGSAYYHTDCYKEIEIIREIIDTYVTVVDANPSFPALRRAINKIVYEQGVDPKLLLFAVKHGNIHKPNGLFYLVKDREILKMWDIEKEKAKTKSASFNATADYSEDAEFNYKQTKNKGFLRILS